MLVPGAELLRRRSAEDDVQTPLLLRSTDGTWRQPAVTAYENEAELQALVKQAPELLTGVPLATVDEFWLPDVGSVDIVGVAADGSVTVIECKLRANPQIRREVVGQVLAYAGGLWQMSYEAFAAAWQHRAGLDLASHVQEQTKTEVQPDELRQAVARNLADGSFTLVIAVDDITDELKRIIEFLNFQTRDEVTVLGVELQYIKDGTIEALIPRTYGEAQPKPHPPGPRACLPKITGVGADALSRV